MVVKAEVEVKYQDRKESDAGEMAGSCREGKGESNWALGSDSMPRGSQGTHFEQVWPQALIEEHIDPQKLETPEALFARRLSKGLVVLRRHRGHRCCKCCSSREITAPAHDILRMRAMRIFVHSLGGLGERYKEDKTTENQVGWAVVPTVSK